MTDDEHKLDSAKKTLKFQMMMSPEEAELLDDWMFKNRVRSRAEAIRRLCQLGLILDGSLLPMVMKNRDKDYSLGRAIQRIHGSKVASREDVMKLFLNFADVVKEAEEYLLLMMAMTDKVLLEASPIYNSREIERAVLSIKEIKDMIEHLDPRLPNDRNRIGSIIDTFLDGADTPDAKA
jgi:hypothetical protein